MTTARAAFMNRSIILTLIVCLFGSGFYIAASFAEDPEPAKGKGRGKSIESIMKTIHGKKGLMKSLGPMLDAKDIDWTAVQGKTKQILPLAIDLGKRKPDKGTKESWAELTEIYAENAKELDAAAAKKDAVATKDYFNELNSSCNKCHARHKGKD